MNRNVYILLLAQFLSAFADNAILFTAIAMTLQTQAAGWYIPALQASFLIAFVVFAPWVGPFADSRPKSSVLITANVIKALGAALMLAQLEPLLAYAVVGAGAAMYSPAKYGILPELVPHHQLVKANGWIEGSTILAILLGSWIGAQLADRTIVGALTMILVLYALSAFSALFITRIPPRLTHVTRAAVPYFGTLLRGLFGNQRARFALLGTSLFWAAAAVLRLMLVAWAPLVLLTSNTSQIAELTLYIALGIALGALIAPRLIPLEQLRRTRLAAYLLGLCILILGLTDNIWLARLALLAIGICGGLFVVPINAALQEIGHRTVGSGGVVAVQNFTENSAMLLATGLYTVAAGQGVHPVSSIMLLGILVFLTSFIIARRLPADTVPSKAV